MTFRGGAGLAFGRCRGGPLLRAAVLGIAALLAACGGQEGTAGGRAAPDGRAGIPAAPAHPPAPALQGGDLVGWTGADLQGRFGPPLLTFAEPPAEVWRYGAARCVALFFLYPATGTADAAAAARPTVVRHVEVLPRDGAPHPAVTDCLQQLGTHTVSAGAG